MSNFISDFLEYNSGTECPKNYLRWTALSALAVAAGLRYDLNQGRITIRPNMYLLLVGEQGNRKSYAKDQARDLIEEAFPDFPIGADVTTRDDLMKFMSDEITERAYVDADGNQATYHPLALFVNELKHFLSYNPSTMISFIVDIFDRKTFKGSTIRRGAEEIVNPCLNILACENTDWLIGRLKDGIITGGFSRRFVVVYEPENCDVIIPRPFLPANGKMLWARMKAHLQNLQSRAVHYKWDATAERFFDLWYKKHKESMPEDQTMRGFMRTKDQQMLKLAMLLDLAEEKPSYTITVDLLETVLAMFAEVEPNMPKLYAAAGRNELALPQQRLIELIITRGNIIAEKELLKIINKDMNTFEAGNVMRHLEMTDQVVKRAFNWPTKDSPARVWVMTPDALRNEKLRKAVLNQWD
jgi:hypothetical protein